MELPVEMELSLANKENCAVKQNNFSTDEWYTPRSLEPEPELRDIYTSTPLMSSTRRDFRPARLMRPPRDPRRERERELELRRRRMRERRRRIDPRARADIDMTGVAIIPGGLDLETDEEMDDEDLGEIAKETLHQLRSAAIERMHESVILAGSHRPLYRAPPTRLMRYYLPRMTTITPCGKCIRM